MYEGAILIGIIFLFVCIFQANYVFRVSADEYITDELGQNIFIIFAKQMNSRRGIVPI
jgi:hypothetical protein